MAYNRYSKLKRDGKIMKSPNITLCNKEGDVYVTYKKATSRLDNISFDIYGDPSFDWLILMANKKYNLEHEIEDGATIRVPYPLQSTLEEYGRKIDLYDNLYGID
jgi:hypothetical protein